MKKIKSLAMLLLGLCIAFTSCEKEPDPIPVTGITLDSSSLTLTEGETARLTATISPSNADNQGVIWSSSDASVASVSNGTVTAVSAGSATITVKSDDGGKTATCNVTVNPMIINVWGVSLDKTSLELTEGDEYTLVATVQPEDASNKAVIWESSDEAIATVSDGKILAKKYGTTTITVLTIDGNLKAECNVIVISKVKVPFEDANFKAFCVQHCDFDKDGEISLDEAEKVREIKVSTNNITSLGGIEYFTNLEKLSCTLNWTRADASHTVFYYGNEIITGGLTSLDLSKNTALSSLDCSSNRLTSLNLSKNTALKMLWCQYNQLTSLDVSECTELTSLDCFENRLSSLDLRNNIGLTKLQCQYNLLTSLNISGCADLTSIRCNNNALESLDVSKNIELNTLNCDDNALASLDVSKNTGLITMSCDNNAITSLDVSKNTLLSSLGCSVNQLTSLDVSNNKLLSTLWCRGNKLTSLDVSNNPELNSLNCAMYSLAYLYIYDGQIIPNITINRSSTYINNNTQIVVK